jgi:hypothetical protein
MSGPISNTNIPNAKCSFCGIDTEISNKLERHLPSCEYRKNAESYIEKIDPHFDFRNWSED